MCTSRTGGRHNSSKTDTRRKIKVQTKAQEDRRCDIRNMSRLMCGLEVMAVADKTTGGCGHMYLDRGFWRLSSQ